ncbi:integrator complex subunit 8 isoform 10-T10 [Morus bassanus]
MSAEAADREAATSSRPCTPPQTSWFEFLLEEALLEQHLQKPSPDPPPVQLIVQFLEQASKPSVNEQNQVQPPPDNKRNRILKLLALKVAAHLKWDLDVLEKSLSVPVLNMLLNELLCISKVPPGTKHVDVDLSSLPPTTAMAILLYNRWAIRTIVQSSFPVKQVKPGPPQLNVMSQVQQEKELTDNILKVLKEQAADSILVLEGALKLNKDLYVHTIRTLDLLAMEPGMVNGETESSTAGLKISAEEIQCQVCYDLGAIYFQQGSTNAAVHENAKEKFFKTKELIAKNGSSSLHFTIDEERLAGYCQACGVLTSSSDDASQQATPYSQIHSCMKSGNYQDLVKIFLEDNLTLSLPVQFRQSVLRELFQKAQQGNDALDEVCFKVCVCNTVCDVLQGRTIDIQFCQLFLKPSKEKIDFLLEVCSRSINLENASEALKRKMAAFLKNLCLGLEDLQLVFMISSHELFIKLLKDDERKLLVDQMRKRSPRINLCTKPVTSFYDIPASASVNIGQLEHQLILSVDPWRIRQILIELHGMTSERQFWTISNKWEVPNVYGNVILGIKDNLTRDLVYILMAKGLHCCAIKDFVHAKQLFAACLELVTEFSPKLRQVMLNEMLLLDIYTHEAGAGVSGERPPSDLISRVRGYLEMRVPDIPLRQVIAEECVAFLLNWRENEYLTMQVPLPLVQTNPYVKVIKRMIKCCSLLNCHTQVAILCQFLREVDYKTAFKALQEQNSHDAMDSYYEYIWDVTILEYLTYLHHKRGETDKRQIAIKAIGQTELNASNPEEVLQLAAQRRKKKFLQAMAKLYF